MKEVRMGGDDGVDLVGKAEGEAGFCGGGEIIVVNLLSDCL
jgi:hypothetical protein